MATNPTLQQLFALTNLQAPADGTTHAAKFIFALPLGGSTLYLNLSGYDQLIGGTFQPQSVTVDNSAGTAAVTFGETIFGWSRQVAAGQSVSFNFPAVKTPQFYLTGTAQQTVNVTFYDFPWFPDSFSNAANAPASVVSISGAVSVTLPSPYNLDQSVYLKTIRGTAISSTVASGTAGKTTYLVGFDIAISGNAAIAAAANNAFTLKLNGGASIWTEAPYIPAAGGTGGPIFRVSKQFAYPFLMQFGQQPTFEFDSAAALTSGNYDVNLWLADI